MKRAHISVAMIGMALLISGCAKYRPQPLDPPEILARVEHERAPAEQEAGKPFTFGRAAELMQTHSPVLKEVRAEYETALALAKVKTPLPSPSLEAGPNYGFGPSVAMNRVMPFGSRGFAIPTGGRLKRQD